MHAIVELLDGYTHATKVFITPRREMDAVQQ